LSLHSFPPRRSSDLVALLSSSEMAFRCHGLEFARARLTHDPGSFRSTPEIVFGVGAAEQTLRPEIAGSFKRLLRSMGEVRHAEGDRKSTRLNSSHEW